MVHRARRVGASPVSRTLLLLALAFAASGCGPSCAGSDATREVLRREGEGWRLVVTCTTSTSVGLVRREGPLLRGCTASGSATLETGAMSRSSALLGCSRASRDCGEVRRYCAALRAEVAERVLREGGEADFAPLFHRAFREPESPRCGELIDALTRTHGDRVLPRDARRSEALTRGLIGLFPPGPHGSPRRNREGS